MADAAAVEAMQALQSCRCCLRRPPDKGLKTLYENVGKTENYWDMLKECFNIHLNVGNDECGICEVCVARLRDATEFKMQVQQSQMELKALLEKALQEKDKKPSLIKVELYEEDPNVEEVMIQDDGPVKSELGDGDIVSIEPSGGEAPDAESDPSEYGDHSSPKCLKDSLTTHVKVHGEGTIHTEHDASNDYQCSLCKKVLANEFSLKVHMRVHTGIKLFSCVVCNKKFGHKHHVKRHMKCHKINIFHCQICREDFTEQSQLKEHELEHTPKITYTSENTCNCCFQRFKLKIDLTKHMEIHKEQILANRSSLEGQAGTDTGEQSCACEVCSKKFSRKDSLIRHIMKFHKGLRVSCRTCDMKFTMQSDLKTHELVHTEKGTHTCETCKKVFDSNISLQIHMLEHMKECDTCGMKFGTQGLLDTHLNTHNEIPVRTHSCVSCKKLFKSKKYLKEHMRVHTDEYTCEACDRKFTRKSYLVSHLNTHDKKKHTGKNMKNHAEKKPYSCTVCHKQFRMEKSLNNHLFSHGDIIDLQSRTRECFYCEICGKRYYCKSSLVDHIKRHMGVLESAFCDVCNKRFANKAALKNHKRIHTGEKPYTCDTCGKRFSERRNLKEHMITHTDEKPYACEVCNKRFSFKQALKVHIKSIHSGEKPHVCNICQKAFALQSTLKKHQAIHTGEKPFPCQVCGKAFITRYLLKKHLLIHNIHI